MGSWKAPGDDLLPIGFLKACGKPLYEVLAPLIEACLELQWFPERFKSGKTIVLAKPRKKPADYQTPAGYRPIALLPTIGKVIEALLAQRIAHMAEYMGILPDEQMGNRQYRSTELAIRLVVAQVQEAWRQGLTPSLLQLDISGAFDTVNHIRLLDTLRKYGFPGWIIRVLKSWLTGRTARLHFDGYTTEPIPI
jgi:Reverse transcriptase (RNA-dependent DNA polymerase)